jgi:hypothetical protein
LNPLLVPRFASLLLLSFFLCFPAGLFAQVTLPLDRQGQDRLYRQVHQLRNPGSLVFPSPATGPGAGSVPFLSFSFLPEVQLRAGQSCGQFHEVMPWRPATLDEADLRWRLGTSLEAELGAGFYLQQVTLIDSDPELDPTVRTKQYRQIDASVDIPWAVAGYRTGQLELWVGRRWTVWGPGWTGSLVLDAQAPAADGLGASWVAEKWAAHFRLGQVDNMVVDGNSRSRYLAGHRLDIALGSRLRLGLSETALVSTSGGLPLWLANPLLPWALTQQEGRPASEPANIIWAADLTWNPNASCTWYGQFLLDDVMVDLEDRDTYPDQLGLLGGIIWSPDPRGPWQLGLEGARIWSWTYVHRSPEVRYQAWSAPLGHPMGPDSEAVTLFIGRQPVPPRPSGKAGSQLFWARWHHFGGISLDTQANPVGGVDLPHPTPPVTDLWQLGVRVEHPLGRSFRLGLQLGWNGHRTEPASVSQEPAADLARGWWGSVGVRLPSVGGRLKL